MRASLYSLRNILWRVVGLLCLLALCPDRLLAQSEQHAGGKKLSVLISGIDDELRSNVEGFLEIFTFDNQFIPSVSRLRYLHDSAEMQIKAALRPFGYYQPVIEVELTEMASTWQAIYRIDPRSRVKIASEPVIDLQGVVVDCDDFRYQRRDRRSLLPEIAVEDDEFNKNKELVIEFCKARTDANLREGRALDQQAYDRLKQAMQTSAAKYGYFDAEFVQQEIVIDPEAGTAQIALVLAPGARYRISEAVISQDIDWIEEDLLRRFVDIEEQDYFDAGKLQALQSDLTNSEYYKRVEVRASAQDAVDRVIPVNVGLVHTKPREYVVGLGYGTDTGVRFRVGVDGRRVNSRGHRIMGEGRISEIGYGLVGGYTIPTGDPRTDSFGLRFGLEREDSDTLDSTGLSFGASYQFQDGLWSKSYAIDYSLDEFFSEGETTTTRLFMPSVEWTRTYPSELERRINTVSGAWVRLSLRGASDSLWSDTSFVQPRLSSKFINTLSNNHRFIVRASAGTTWVDDFQQLPLQLRYYAGGDSSVRGYKYRNISPRDENNDPLGGQNLIEASVEYEFPVRDRFSLAAFSDFGDAFTDEPEYRIGVGVGLRWQSPIGPVRLDLAKSLVTPGEGNVRPHLTIGPDL